MAVPKIYEEDVRVVADKRRDNGGDFWATPDGRWGTGSPFSTFDCVLILHELGVPKSDRLLTGAADVLLAAVAEDGRIRPAPKGTVYPCHTANAARALGRLGHGRDKRLAKTFERLLETRHEGGGWRCNRAKLGKSAATDASNPGVTLAALDALRFTRHRDDERLDAAVRTLLSHWKTKAPLGPCGFGIGTLFSQIEYPFLRYNLFYWVYVLSFYPKAVRSREYRQALKLLESKLEDGRVPIENPNRRLAKLAFCRKGETSRAATRRYREILANVERAG